MDLIREAQTLLLIEDNRGDADLVVELLAQSDARPFNVIHVPTLMEAASPLRNAHIDAVLLDLRLPDGAGVDCVHAVRAQSSDVPIVVLTGLDDDAAASSCLAAGAQDYILKHELRRQTLRRAIKYAIAGMVGVSARRRADALQECLSAIVESSSDAIVSSDINGVITSWNRGAEMILGYTKDEAIGRLVGEVMRHERRSAPRAGDAPRIAERSLPLMVAEETVRIRKDGRAVTLSVVQCDVRNAAGDVIGFAATCKDLTQDKRLNRELRDRREELAARGVQMRALAARLTVVRDEERARIAQAIHDEVEQVLAGLKEHLAAERFADADQLADQAILTAQRIGVELRQNVLETERASAAPGKAVIKEPRPGGTGRPSMRNILIADPRELTRRGVTEILFDAFAGVNVVECSEANDMLAILPAYSWDLILLNVGMPGAKSCDMLARIRAQMPGVPILILTGKAEVEFVVSTIKAGGNGLLHTDRTSDDLLDAVMRIADGGIYMHVDTAAAIALNADAKPLADLHHTLSRRELEIFRSIAVGRSVKEIAAALQLSHKTVATYISRIRDKTGLASHVDVARYALHEGLVD